MRFYGFDVKELTTPEAPDLPLHTDPKLAWALRHREFFPVDVNQALARGAAANSRLRSARRWIAFCEFGSIHRLRNSDLAKLHVPLNRARHFIVTADSRPELLRCAALLPLESRRSRRSWRSSRPRSRHCGEL